MSADIQRRREDLHASAERSRIAKMLESGRSSSIRERLADGAESLSDLFAGLAQAMRDREA